MNDQTNFRGLTDQQINALIEFRKSGNKPARFNELSPSAFSHWQAKFKHITLTADNMLIEQRNNASTGEQITREIILNADKETVMKSMYQDPTMTGMLSFYSLVNRKYINITRAEVIAFLRNQNGYQLSRPVVTERVVNAPIISNYPRERILLDLTSMEDVESHNKHYLYILTIIDHFSGFAWAVPLKSKESIEIRDRFREILPISDKSKYDMFHYDNGKEFSLLTVYHS